MANQVAVLATPNKLIKEAANQIANNIFTEMQKQIEPALDGYLREQMEGNHFDKPAWLMIAECKDQTIFDRAKLCYGDLLRAKVYGILAQTEMAIGQVHHFTNDGTNGLTPEQDRFEALVRDELTDLLIRSADKLNTKVTRMSKVHVASRMHVHEKTVEGDIRRDVGGQLQPVVNRMLGSWVRSIASANEFKRYNSKDIYETAIAQLSARQPQTKLDEVPASAGIKVCSIKHAKVLKKTSWKKVDEVVLAGDRTVGPAWQTDDRKITAQQLWKSGLDVSRDKEANRLTVWSSKGTIDVEAVLASLGATIAR